jgi:glycine betaine/proline transport system substrate-binding protein
MGSVLEKAGYAVEYVPADYLAQFAGLKTGDLHVAMEIWATTGQEALDEAVATGNVENLGETGFLAIEEWWYPEYMKEKCPGLPNWEALKGCAAAFSTPETAPKGRYLGAPVTWGGFDEERIAALNMPFEIVHAGTDAALFAELESAYQRNAPVLLWVYAPHWAPLKFKGEWVEFPKYEKACYTDPAWGTNPAATHDCGKPRGPVWIAAWAGLKDKWPGAYQTIKSFKMDNDEMGGLITQVDLDGKKVEDVVAAWMTANETRWQAWIVK